MTIQKKELDDVDVYITTSKYMEALGCPNEVIEEFKNSEVPFCLMQVDPQMEKDFTKKDLHKLGRTLTDVMKEVSIDEDTITIGTEESPDELLNYKCEFVDEMSTEFFKSFRKQQRLIMVVKVFNKNKFMLNVKALWTKKDGFDKFPPQISFKNHITFWNWETLEES